MKRSAQLPYISVCLPTYKRHEFLQEFLWCYLRQDYPKDRRELIILDDADQYLPFIDENENIKLVSTQKRFPTLGEKRNAFLSLMDRESEFMFIADDDDLYYPHWISAMMLAGEKADIIVPSMMIEWQWETNPQYRHTPGWGYHHAASAFRKTAFMELGGYPHQQRQEDYVLFCKFEANKNRYKKAEVSWKIPYTIRRSGCWRGTYTTTSMNQPEYDATLRHYVKRQQFLTPQSPERYFKMTQEILQRHYEDDLVIIRSAVVGFGTMEVNTLGYTHVHLPENMAPEDYLLLSGHCPSEIKLLFKKKVSIKGVLNGTSHWSPAAACLFLVSDNIVGYLFGPLDATREMILEPGEYTLEVTSLDSAWKHSLWAIREVPEV